MPPLVRKAFTFRDAESISILGLQSDSAVERKVHADGAVFQLTKPEEALALCRLTFDVASLEHPDLIVLPELSVPVDALDELVARTKLLTGSTLVLAGLEGMHPGKYAGLVEPTGEALDINPASGSYVNALAIIVNDADGTKLSFRAKRLAAADENQHVNPCLGTSGFQVVELGPKPVRVLPLVCAEFRNTIWDRIRGDVGDSPIDLVAVIQMNYDPEQAYPSVALTNAFAAGAPFGTARFLLANRATLPEKSDGATYLIYPPTALRPPTYEHTRTELWHVPRANGYHGFRMPDNSGSIWKMSVRLPSAPTDAYREIPCRGSLLRVWRPSTQSDHGGLALGLMRTRAASLLLGPRASAEDSNSRVRQHLDMDNARYVVGELVDTSASTALFWASIAGAVDWPTVENVTSDLVESAALLGAGDKDAKLVGAACNCSVNGRGVAILHAPNETDALTKRFSMENCMPPHPLPRGAVTFGVDMRSLGDTRVVGARIRSDRITRGAATLQGMPPKPTESAVDLDALNFKSCELEDLRNLFNLNEQTALARLTQLLPEVFA